MNKKWIFLLVFIVSLQHLACVKSLSYQKKHPLWNAFRDPQATDSSSSTGFKDESGKIVLPARFGTISKDFGRDEVAAVYSKEGVEFINRKGHVIAKAFFYDNGADYFIEGVARFTGRDGKIGFINRQGKIVIPPQYDVISPFHMGYASFCVGCSQQDHRKAGETDPDDHHPVMTGGKWGLVDHYGILTLEPKYDRIEKIEYDRVQVILNGTKKEIKLHLYGSEESVNP